MHAIRRNQHPKIQALLPAVFILLSTALCAVVSASIGGESLKAEMQKDILGIAQAAAQFTDGDLHQTLTRPEQKDSEDYRRVQAPYQKLLAAYPYLRYIYTAVLRDGNVYFIIDTQPSGSADARSEEERNTTADIMEEYPDATPKLREALKHAAPLVENEIYQDEWGRFLSAYAPIYSSKKEFIGIVGIDIDAAYFSQSMRNIWRTGAAGIALAFIFAMGAYIYVLRNQRQNLLAQEDVRLSEERLNLAVTGSTDGLWDWDVVSGNVYYSPRFMALTGHAQHALPHTIETFTNLIHPDDRVSVNDAIVNHFKKRGPYIDEYRLRHKDGRYIWCQARGQASWNDAGRAVRMTGFTMDISARKEVEESLRLAHEEAERTTYLKSEFLANMSHEIRTPMNGIIGMSSLLMDTALDARQQSYVNTVIHSSEALLQIVNDILDFSKIEAGKMELENVPFDFQMLVEEVAELMATKAHEHKIELLLRYAPGTPRSVIGDPGRVRQIFFNLISNAIKFTEKGHVLIDIDASATEEKIRYQVRVEDTGVGIPEEKLGCIFSKFTQADGSTTRKFGGTGLGLAICKQLVDMIGGEIGVESELGKGSVFWFTLLLESTGADAEHYPACELSPSALKGVGIVVFDDNETARFVVQEQLQSVGAIVYSARSEAKFFAQLKQLSDAGNPARIIVVDYQIPGMDIDTLTQRLNSDPATKDILRVMLTSVPSRGDSKHFFGLGFKGYLPKPYNASELIDMLTLIHTQLPTQMLTRYSLKEYKNFTKHGEQRNIFFENTQILLVEDNLVNQQVARALLGKLGCQVAVANDGEEALQMINQNRFDLVLMDCQMPVMDGYEATKMIRKMEALQDMPRIPIVALTANAIKGDDEKCFAVGMDGYLAKPLKPDDLAKTLVAWLSPLKRVNSSAA